MLSADFASPHVSPSKHQHRDVGGQYYQIVPISTELSQEGHFRFSFRWSSRGPAVLSLVRVFAIADLKIKTPKFQVAAAFLAVSERLDF